MSARTRWLTRDRTIILVVLTLIGWGAFFYFVPPDTLVEGVGIQNTYAVAFLISLVAGFSTLTGTAAYATVIEFARGGANPLLLGIIAGVGLFLSDSAFYLLVMRGRVALGNRLGRWLARFHQFVERVPRWVVYVGVYLFCAIGPIPNDVMMTVMIIGGYQYRKLWIPLLLGDITFMLLLSHLFAQ